MHYNLICVLLIRDYIHILALHIYSNVKCTIDTCILLNACILN